jgi:magnesium transporter
VIRLHYHPPGTPPATLAHVSERSHAKPVITLTRYNAQTIEEIPVESVENLPSLLLPGFVNWVNVDGLGDISTLEALGKVFGIHPLALEDVLNTTQRPKAEPFPEHLFIVTAMVYSDAPGDIIAEQLSLFLGASYVLTFQEECGRDVFDKVRARLRLGRGFGRKSGPDYLAYVLLDATLDQFFPLIENLGDATEDIEDVLLERPTRATLKQLYDVKRLVMMLRRSAWPQREIFSVLLRDDSGLIAKETQVFLRDCYDHSTQIIDILESYRDLAAGLMDVYLSSLGFRTNEIMRLLTVVSLFFLPLSFIAGVYGMNFDTKFPLNMPELGWPYGYLFFWVLCAGLVAMMFAFFKRKDWL